MRTRSVRWPACSISGRIPSVRRVVTLGTPHRGSEFSNGVTRWLGRKLITLPARCSKAATN